MVSVFKHALFVHALICGGWANRVKNQLLDKDPGAADDLRTIFAQPRNLICGGGEIRSLLTSNPSVDGVRNLPWPRVLAIADEYLKDQTRFIPDLTQQIEELKAQIAEKKHHESKRVITEKEVKDLIAASLEAEGSYGSLEKARESKCGGADRAICRKLKVRASAYRKCSAAFEVKARDFFTGKVKVKGSEFRKVCDEVLPGDSMGVMASYCDELCQGFADIAQTLSDQTAGEHAGSSSEQLEAKLLNMQQQLKYAIAEREECQNARDALMGFRIQLDGLQKDIKRQFERVQDAREDLAEYEETVYDIEEELTTMEEAVSDAIQTVSGTGTKVTVARKALNELKDKEKEARTRLSSTQDSFRVTNTLLGNANTVNDITSELKGLVSQTMLNMALYFDEAVREPLRNLGLDESMDVDDKFQESPASLPSATDFDESVGQLDSFCKKEALPAFAKVSGSVKLAPICNIGATSEVIGGVNEAVSARMESVKDTIKHVMSRLDPYKGTRALTEEEAKKKIEEGEPLGLREVMGDFGQTTYYRNYLKHWKATAKPSFLAIYAKLGDEIERLYKELEDLSQSITALEKALDEILAKLRQATTSLEEAITADEIAEDKKAKAEAAVAKQEEVLVRALDDLAALKKAAEDALKSYVAAKKLLEEVHQKGTSMVQAW
mmetsp:Transcript_92635/g.299700  ORF Transcript_92635/g.299700 Transcript_92635/m.299700 type:complete len:668 (+) Transcript_92635:94-2097(+)